MFHVKQTKNVAVSRQLASPAREIETPAFTKADQAREIGFAWLNGAQEAADDLAADIGARATRAADRTGYPNGSSAYAAFVAGHLNRYAM